MIEYLGNHELVLVGIFARASPLGLPPDSRQIGCQVERVRLVLLFSSCQCKVRSRLHKAILIIIIIAFFKRKTNKKTNKQTHTLHTLSRNTYQHDTERVAKARDEMLQAGRPVFVVSNVLSNQIERLEIVTCRQGSQS